MSTVNVNLGLRQVATGNGVQSIVQTVLLPRTTQNNAIFQMFVPNPPLYFLDSMEHIVTYFGPAMHEFAPAINHCNLNSAPDITGDVVLPLRAEAVENWVIEEGYEWGGDIDVVLDGFDVSPATVYSNPATYDPRTWRHRYYPGKYLQPPNPIVRVGLYNNLIEVHVFTELIDDFGDLTTIRCVDNRLVLRWIPTDSAVDFLSTAGRRT